VFIVTGASAGVGEKLAEILYQKNAKVYLATRSAEKTARVITRIQTAYPSSAGSLVFLQLDLADLTKIKAAATTFLAQETRLDVLWLNAGVMIPPAGSKTVQGWELQLGTNNLGHFLFAKLLHPVLVQTAATAPAGSVRVVWVSSSAAELFAPKPPIDFANINYERKSESAWATYGRSKAGNVLHASEYARRAKEDGIVSVVRWWRWCVGGERVR
jgi:NAD(P)-dependent dehydrogenase (short-subunit alcohol dehydrogenase family)